jgi:hypothetical protein
VAVRRAVNDDGSGIASLVALTEPFHPLPDVRKL